MRGPHPGSPQQHPLRLGGHSARRGLPDPPLWPWRQRLHQQPGQRATHGAAEPERSRWTPGTKGDAGGGGWWFSGWRLRVVGLVVDGGETKGVGGGGFVMADGGGGYLGLCGCKW